MQKKPLYSAEKSEAYKTSQDYKHLKELLDNNINVVCFINYDISPQTKFLFQDICIARKLNQCYQFDARGISYASWCEEFARHVGLAYTFEELCAAMGVEFIEPTKTIKAIKNGNDN